MYGRVLYSWQVPFCINFQVGIECKTFHEWSSEKWSVLCFDLLASENEWLRFGGGCLLYIDWLPIWCQFLLRFAFIRSPWCKPMSTIKIGLRGCPMASFWSMWCSPSIVRSGMLQSNPTWSSRWVSWCFSPNNRFYFGEPYLQCWHFRIIFKNAVSFDCDEMWTSKLAYLKDLNQCFSYTLPLTGTKMVDSVPPIYPMGALLFFQY